MGGWHCVPHPEEIDCKPRIADDIVMKYTVGYNIRHFIFPKKGTEITPLFSMPTATRSDDDIARLMSVHSIGNRQ